MSDDARSSIRTRIEDLIDDGDACEIALIERLVASFLDRAPGLIADLFDAVAQHDAPAARHWAHKLKGAASNLGVSTVAELSFDVERLAAEAQLAPIAGYRSRIEHALAGARVDFTQILGELARAA
jgi:HPt (histidine-containing phosphotransfer) domain-containing protein